MLPWFETVTLVMPVCPSATPYCAVLVMVPEFDRVQLWAGPLTIVESVMASPLALLIVVPAATENADEPGWLERLAPVVELDRTVCAWADALRPIAAGTIAGAASRAMYAQPPSRACVRFLVLVGRRIEGAMVVRAGVVIGSNSHDGTEGRPMAKPSVD